MSRSEAAAASGTHGVFAFITALRWIAAVFGVTCAAGTAVLAFRAPDCIAIGVSVLRAEDCTNRETYYLLLAASAAAATFFCVLLFVSAYALELLASMAPRRPGVSGDDAAS